VPVTDVSKRATVACPFCGTLNRVDLSRIGDRPKCGSCGRPILLDRPVAVTDATLDAVLKGTEVPVVLDGYADWCGPCKIMAPVLDDFARDHQGEVLVPEARHRPQSLTTHRFGIRAIPTLLVFRQGKEMGRQTARSRASGWRPWRASRRPARDLWLAVALRAVGAARAARRAAGGVGALARRSARAGDRGRAVRGAPVLRRARPERHLDVRHFRRDGDLVCVRHHRGGGGDFRDGDGRRVARWEVSDAVKDAVTGPNASQRRVSDLEDRMFGLESQVGELAERLDFAERLLAQAREREAYRRHNRPLTEYVREQG